MIKRELRKGKKGPVMIAVLRGDMVEVYERPRPHDEPDLRMGYRGYTFGDARNHFHGELAKLRRKGFKETPVSLTRQELTEQRDGEAWVWAVEIDGKDRITYWCKWGGHATGRRRTFDSEDEARRSADQLVAKKLAGGFQRVSRETHEVVKDEK